MHDTRRLLYPAAIMVVMMWLAGAIFAAEQQRYSPPFEGEGLPEPPQQAEPWSPPAPPETDLPETLLSATEVLFRQGLADPRGCEYREIEVGTGSVWSGDAGLLATHAWLLPGRAGQRQRFAVCWNGLVYPVVSVGEPADVEADIRAVIKADEERRAAWQKAQPAHAFSRLGRTQNERESVGYQSLQPIKVCLLLRLGKASLAAELWEAWTAGLPPRSNDNDVTLRDPYLQLARDWTWAIFDRAIGAHMRGDDRLALLSAEALVPLRNAVEEEAARRGFERPRSAQGDDKIAYLTFLGPLDRLVQDQRRRAKQPRLERVSAAGIEKFPEQSERIAALLRDLESVSARQWGQPGGVDLSWDPIVLALIQEGDAAVGPLIDCLESDWRLTRSVRFHRDFSRHREVIAVDAAAFAALTKIMEIRTFGPETTHGYQGSTDPERRRAVAAEIRALWEQTRSAGPEERWYQLLADDEGTPHQWVEAAGRIVQPAGDGRPADGPRPLQGEPLRVKTEPSVTELMIRRANQLVEMGRPGSERMFNLHRACAIALSLAKWDGQAALPTLGALIRRCQAEMTDAQPSGSWTVQILGRYIAQMTLAAANADGRDMLSEYAAWIRTTSPDALDSYVQDAVEPLWRHADHPKIAAAADWLFDDDRSPWYVLREAVSGHGGLRLARLLDSPLVGLPGMRRQLLRELANRQVLGTVQIKGGRSLSIRMAHAHSGTQMRYRDDPRAPPPETDVEFRVCDYVAWSLSRLEGTPLAELYWPESERDTTIARCAAFLEQWGERFQYSADHPPTRGTFGLMQARFTLPQLDRPATPEDVRDSLAIFALAGGETVQAVPLDPFPIRARWTTLKQFPYQVETIDAQGERTWITRHDQEGWVWQAEEIVEDGRRVRYYGFVGRYILGQVPAEDIELLGL